MNFTPKFPILERLAPDVQTRAGIAWRLYWLWPQLRFLNLFALVAWIVTMLIGGLHLNLQPFAGAEVLGAIAFIVLLHQLLLGFLGGTPKGGYALACNRALTMLPVQSARLRDAVWFIDIPAAPLVYCVACLLPLLIVPLSLQYRVWFLAAALLGVLFYAGFRASMALGMHAFVPRRPRGLGDFLVNLIPKLAPLLLVVCPLGIAMVYGVQQANWAAAAIGAAMVAWSFIFRPMMTGTRDEVGTFPKNVTPAFSSRWRGIASLCIGPAAKIIAFLMLFLVIEILGKPFWDVGLGYGSIFVGMYVVSGCHGEAVAKGLRAARLLPVSSRGLTIALHVQGFLPAIAFLLPVGLLNTPDPVNLALLIAAAIFLTALSAASIWTPFYPNESGVAVIVFMGSLFLVIGVLMENNRPISREQIALIAMLVSVPFFAAVARSIDRHFWWKSRVYRHQSQPRQRNFRLSTVSAADEELMLTAAFIVGILGVFLSLRLLIGSIA